MENLLSNILKDIKSGKEDDFLSLLIYIANCKDTTLSYIDMETISTILCHVIQQLYPFFHYAEILNDIFTKNQIDYYGRKIFIADEKLFLAILFNSIRIYNETSKINIEIPNSFIKNILVHIDIEKRYTMLLLRTLKYILLKEKEIPLLLCEQIVCVTQKVALSPLSGFKRYAHDISQIVIPFLNRYTKMLDNINLIPLKGIDTADIVNLYSEEYIRNNKENIVKKICYLFNNNLDNKDGECLYTRLITFYAFKEWKKEILPLFLPYLKKFDDYGEFYQSLLKYWISSNVKAYKADFYFFVESQPINNLIKINTFLETRKCGYSLDNTSKQQFYDVNTINLRFKIISTFYKKSLVPDQYERNFFLDFLCSNIKDFLESDVIKDVKMFLSQLFLYAHNDLKKSTSNFDCYSKFVCQIYKFCCGNLVTDLFEVGAQVLQIFLNISKGGYKNLLLLYKLEKSDFYGEGENLLYQKLKFENLWNFESDEIISRLKCCFAVNQGCNRTLIELINFHYPISTFININVLKNVMLSTEEPASSTTIDKVLNLSQLLFKKSNDKELQEYAEQLSNELLLILDGQEILHSGLLIHKATLSIIILTNAFASPSSVHNLQSVIYKSLTKFRRILDNSSANYSKFGSVKMVESFINNVIFSLNRHLNSLWRDLDKEFLTKSVIEIIAKSNMKRPVTLCTDLLKMISSKMESEEEDKVIKIKILQNTLNGMFNRQENKNYKIRRNPETRLVLHALCLHEKRPDSPLLNWVLNFLLEILNDSKSSEGSLTPALHCIEIFVSDNSLHEYTIKFIPRLIESCVETSVNKSWTVRNANLQLVKALIERLYGVSLGLYNRPKDISDLFFLYPQLYTYFFKVLNSENLDQRAYIVFQFFLESQLKEKLISEYCIKILNCFQLIFMKCIKEYDNHYGKLAVRSFIALCSIRDIPAMVYDIKAYIETNLSGMKKNILSNFILLLQGSYGKFKGSFQCTLHTNQIVFIENCLLSLANSLKLSDVPIFYPILYNVSFLQANLSKIKCLQFENNYLDRIWLNNNLYFLLMNSRDCDIGNICDTLLSSKLPSFAQIKILNILISKFEKESFRRNDIETILKVLFKSTTTIDDKNNFLLASYLKVILVFENSCADMEIDSTISLAKSENLFRNLIFVTYIALRKKDSGDKSLIKDNKFIEQQLIKNIATSEEIDYDILSVLWHSKQNSIIDNLNFCKLIFYFCTNESTYLYAHHIISVYRRKDFCSILTLLKDFFHPDHLCTLLEQSDITKLYKDLNSALETTSYTENSNSFYQIEGDELIPYGILQNLIRYLSKKFDCSSDD